MKRSYFPYAVLLYLLNLILCGLFSGLRFANAGVIGIVYLIFQCIACAFIYLLPVYALLLPAYFLKGGKWKCFLETLAAFVAAIISLLLILDWIVLFRFGYHINGLVINLLLTPGGFESMGLDSATIVPGVLGILFFLGLHWLLMYLFAIRGIKLIKLLDKPGFIAIVTGGVVVSVAAALLICAFGDFYANAEILSQHNAFPVPLNMRMRKFLLRMGCEEPEREATYALMKSTHASLKYPVNPIVRDKSLKKYNFVWLTCESLRADLMSSEVMPAGWKLSENGWRFENHYSGGHGTRPAMFSMFYGLYGLNWDSFLHCRRGPLFFDCLLEDNYQMLCQTSANFTYPEFNKTIFAAVRTNDIIEYQKKIKEPWKRDIQLVDTMIEFIKGRDASRPFFAFGFFESTHAPYSFPEDETVLKHDYYAKINYATVTEKDAQLLYNRQANAAHHIDLQIKRVLDFIDETPELRDNTIVIITGDHGEEFYEKGRLGHNSTFVEEQIKTPLVIRIPGTEHFVAEYMTNHVDIFPTLAPYLGISNPVSDYSVGCNLAQKEKRNAFYVVCGWDTAILINNDYKCMLPIGKGNFFSRSDVTHRDDSPCDETVRKQFFSNYANQLTQAQQDIARFF